MTGFEPVASSLPRKRSTPELHRQEIYRARDRVRTGDIQLGRLTLYQLSYSRFCFSGESRIRTCEDIVSRFTVCPRWPLEYLPNKKINISNSFLAFSKNLTNPCTSSAFFLSRWRDSNPRPADYKSAALAS